ncbi:hypothetical protein [Streptomyces arenae]|uniref:hypothetical protein n=1 Tax=Streptomyces arenae TaxID=29301 RepID=UPI0026593CB0|nr:hypothetical protein [Streptomyces arenae]MCG7208638.1 hypothetical protein [Streptomyces arenae]
MADEQYKWLNRTTAERLLRGESLEAVDESARDQAERLAGTLGALSARSTRGGAELPGEEAALAAFRKARESAETEPTAVAARSGRTRQGGDAGLFRLDAGSRSPRVPGWARPARLGLAAALTAGMLGGVAVAAGTGVLPTPFRDDRPGPAASVSAAGTTQRPQGSPSPESLLGGESDAPRSGEPSTGSAQPSPGASGRSKERDTGSAGAPRNGWSGALASCRAVRNGRSLDADRKRALERFAGGAGRVDKFCTTVLDTGKNGGKGAAGDGKGGAGGQGGQGDQGGQGGQSGQGDGNGQGGAGDGRPGRGGGAGGGGNDPRQDGVATPAPTAFAPLAPNRPVSVPSPTYSAL